MILDTVLTVAIGRNDATGTAMYPGEWARFRRDVRTLCDRSATVVAETVGTAIGSDGPNDGTPEETAVYVMINPTGDFDTSFRAALADVLATYSTTSACFAIDRTHEPVFATTDGWR